MSHVVFSAAVASGYAGIVMGVMWVGIRGPGFGTTSPSLGDCARSVAVSEEAAAQALSRSAMPGRGGGGGGGVC